MPRRLGQHFLRASSVERLIDAINPGADQDFVEIELERGLSRSHSPRGSTDHRDRARFSLGRPPARAGPANVEVIEGDALKIDLGALLSPGGRIVGNLPYAISSPLLRRFLDLRDRATDLNVILQKEVADRMAATAGSKDYGILSVLYGIWASTSIPLRFGPGCFEPPPRSTPRSSRPAFAPSPTRPSPVRRAGAPAQERLCPASKNT